MKNITWKYIKKLKTNNLIDEFMKDNNIDIPSDIIECVQDNNGGRPSKTTYDTENEKEREIKTLLSFNKEDLENVYDIYDILKDEGLLPIASDPAGNYICYDLNNKEMVLWLHETDKVEKISDTFTGFLDKLYD